MHNKVLLNNKNSSNTSLTIKCMHSPAGWYIDLYDYETGGLLLENVYNNTIELAIGQRVRMHCVRDSGGGVTADKGDGEYTIKNSSGIYFINIPTNMNSDLEFYTTSNTAYLAFTLT